MWEEVEDLAPECIGHLSLTVGGQSNKVCVALIYPLLVLRRQLVSLLCSSTSTVDNGCAMGLDVGCLHWVVRVVGALEQITRIGTSLRLVMVVVRNGSRWSLVLMVPGERPRLVLSVWPLGPERTGGWVCGQEKVAVPKMGAAFFILFHFLALDSRFYFSLEEITWKRGC